jgi:Na+-translocating ferredoxin:NAD+ oxidoreductase RnfE subunit
LVRVADIRAKTLTRELSNMKQECLLLVYHVPHSHINKIGIIMENLCVVVASEVKVEGIRGVAGKEAYVYCPFYKHYFPVAVLCRLLLVMSLVYTAYAFSFYLQASGMVKMHSLVPDTVCTE